MQCTCTIWYKDLVIGGREHFAGSRNINQRWQEMTVKMCLACPRAACSESQTSLRRSACVHFQWSTRLPCTWCIGHSAPDVDLSVIGQFGSHAPCGFPLSGQLWILDWLHPDCHLVDQQGGQWGFQYYRPHPHKTANYRLIFIFSTVPVSPVKFFASTIEMDNLENFLRTLYRDRF